MNDNIKKAVDRVHKRNIINKILGKNKNKKMKQSDIFEKLPKDSHLMSDGKTIMSGFRHSKNSKVIGKLKRKKKTYNPISKKQY